MNGGTILFRGALFCTMYFVAAVAYAQPTYTGLEGCASCHKKEVASWERSPHAKAYETLLPGKRKATKKKAGLDPEKDYSKEEKCVKCHVTGFGKKGGFKDINKTPEMKGVGCESCHGAGSEYRVLHDEKPTFSEKEARAAGQLYGGKDEKVCTACHNKESAVNPEVHAKYNFDWQKALKDRRSFHLKAKSKYGFGGLGL